MFYEEEYEGMFCSNCGTQIEDGVKYCPNCGTPVDTGEIKGFVYNDSMNPNDGASSANSSGSYYNNGAGSDNRSSGYTYNVMPLRTDRSLLVFVLLSFITCGIYWFIFVYQLIRDVNIACEGDGEETPGLLIFLLLSIITCGIYSFYWYYKLGDRLAANAGRYGYPVSENGVTILLWMLLGQFACCVGPFIAWHLLITNTNLVCTGYNREHGVG